MVDGFLNTPAGKHFRTVKWIFDGFFFAKPIRSLSIIKHWAMLVIHCLAMF